MRLNVGFSVNGRPVTMENGCQGRLVLLENSLSSKFFALKSKKTIALLTIPRAIAMTVNLVALRSLAFLADRFVSVIKTLRDPEATGLRKAVKVLVLPLKLAVGVAGLGVGVVLTPLLVLGYTIQGLLVMNSTIRGIFSEKAKMERNVLLQGLGAKAAE